MLGAPLPTRGPHPPEPARRRPTLARGAPRLPRTRPAPARLPALATARVRGAAALAPGSLRPAPRGPPFAPALPGRALRVLPSPPPPAVPRCPPGRRAPTSYRAASSVLRDGRARGGSAGGAGPAAGNASRWSLRARRSEGAAEGGGPGSPEAGGGGAAAAKPGPNRRAERAPPRGAPPPAAASPRPPTPRALRGSHPGVQRSGHSAENGQEAWRGGQW